MKPFLCLTMGNRRNISGDSRKLRTLSAPDSRTPGSRHQTVASGGLTCRLRAGSRTWGERCKAPWHRLRKGAFTFSSVSPNRPKAVPHAPTPATREPGILELTASESKAIIYPSLYIFLHFNQTSRLSPYKEFHPNPRTETLMFILTAPYTTTPA